MSGVRKATEADRAVVVETLLRAFEHDPFVGWVVGGDGRLAARRRYFRLAFEELTLPHGTAYVAEEGAAVALWAPPRAWELGLVGQLLLLPKLLRVVGIGRFGRIAEGVRRVERTRPPQPWYILALLGTDPTHQGRGLGSEVLRPILARCDAEGVPAVLDTCVEFNVAFYRRHGFEPLAEVELPEGPRVYSMIRPPAGSSGGI